MPAIVGARLRRYEGADSPRSGIESRLTARQAFPTRTEGSVKKHWYKVGRATPIYTSILIAEIRTCTTPNSPKTRYADSLGPAFAFGFHANPYRPLLSEKQFENTKPTSGKSLARRSGNQPKYVHGGTPRGNSAMADWIPGLRAVRERALPEPLAGASRVSTVAPTNSIPLELGFATFGRASSHETCQDFPGTSSRTGINHLGGKPETLKRKKKKKKH